MFRFVPLLLAALVTAASAGCGGASSDGAPPSGVARYLAPSMALPPELAADADVVPLPRTRWWREPLSFPPYRVASLRESWVRERGRSLILGRFSHSTSLARQPFSFVLEYDGAPAWTVDCEWSASRRRTGWTDDDEEAIVEKIPRTFLACELWDEERAAEPWSLWLSIEPAGGLLSSAVVSEGALTDGERELDLDAVLALAGTRLHAGRPSGYLFSDDQGALAAIEVTTSGRFIVARDLGTADRKLLAAASAALFVMDRAVFTD